jgi:hypothetical protein
MKVNVKVDTVTHKFLLLKLFYPYFLTVLPTT